MDKIDFFEIASYCQRRFKDYVREDDNACFVQTQFFCITEDGKISHSNTPHILKDAKQSIMIHEISKLAFTNWYSWYFTEFIDADGSVHRGGFDNNFKLVIEAKRKWKDQVMKLKYHDTEIYSCERPWEDHMHVIWEMYNRVKKAETPNERALISLLLKSDEKVLQLEKEVKDFKFVAEVLKQERDQYQGLLDEIVDLCQMLKRESSDTDTKD